MSQNLFKKPLFWLSAILGAILFFQIASFVNGQTGNPPGDAGQILKINSDGALVIATTTITNEGSNRDLIFSPTGNVGIGISETPEKLTVGGNVQADVFIGQFVGSLSSANVSSDVFGRTVGEGNFAFPASLGIGVTSQSGLLPRLQINGFGAGTYSNDILAINTQTDGPSGILIDNDGNFNVGAVIRHQFIRPDLYSILSLGTRGYDGIEQTLNIKQGNVGIGTTIPLYKLDVAGDINIGAANVYRRGGIAGISLTCPVGQTVATTTVSGGIITNGTCAPIGSGAAPTDASYVVISANGTLTAERVLTAGAGISILDNEANGNVTITNTGVRGSGTDNYITRWAEGPVIEDSVVYDGGTGIGIGTGPTTDLNYRITVAGNATATKGGIKAKGGTSDQYGYALYAENFALNNLFAVRNDKQIFINNVSYSWPDTQGVLNTYLKNDGSGNLAWTTVSGGSGTVTSISAGAGLTATLTDPITTAGTINVGVDSTLSTTADTVGINPANANTWTAAQAFSGGTSTAVSCTDCIALSTETTGNYIGGITAGTGIAITGTPGEEWYAGIAIKPNDSISWSVAQTFSGGANFPVSGIWDSSGKVGIGTTGPRGKLDVQPSNTNGANISNYFGGTSAYSLTLNGNQDNNAKATILQNAYALYNTTSEATYKWITASGSFGSRGLAFSFGGSGAGIIFYADSAATTAGSTFTPTARMIIQNNGNVGIGTTTPQSTLDVAGQIRISTASNLWLSGGGNIALESGKRVGYSPDTASFAGVQVANGQLDLFTGNSSRLLINSSGNVGIGTTNPKAKLVVVGQILTTSAVSRGARVSCSGGVTFNVQDFTCLGPIVTFYSDTFNNYIGETDSASIRIFCQSLGGLEAVSKLTVGPSSVSIAYTHTTYIEGNPFQGDWNAVGYPSIKYVSSVNCAY